MLTVGRSIGELVEDLQVRKLKTRLLSVFVIPAKEVPETYITNFACLPTSSNTIQFISGLFHGFLYSVQQEGSKGSLFDSIWIILPRDTLQDRLAFFFVPQDA